MSILIHLTRILTPTEVNELKQLVTPVNALLLSQDGVYMAQHFSANPNVYLLEDDMTARAINSEHVNANGQIINYAAFVELTLNYNSVLNW